MITVDNMIARLTASGMPVISRSKAVVEQEINPNHNGQHRQHGCRDGGGMRARSGEADLSRSWIAGSEENMQVNAAF